MRVETPNNRMSCFSLPKPADISEEQWDIAKTHASMIGTRLPQQTEDAAFYFFVLGDALEDIAARLNLPIGVMVYTCLMSKWHEKRKALTKEASKNKMQRADQAAVDLLTDAIIATTAIYRTQIAQAMRDPEKAKDCPFIPKNLKEIETLLKLFKSFDASNLPQQTQPNIHLNIANMLGNRPRVESVDEPLEIESPNEARQDRLRVLELLKAVKEDK
jgi:hypothetical protein